MGRSYASRSQRASSRYRHGGHGLPAYAPFSSRKILRVTKFHTMTMAVANTFTRR